jgi:hypothetical protein
MSWRGIAQLIRTIVVVGAVVTQATAVASAACLTWQLHGASANDGGPFFADGGNFSGTFNFDSTRGLSTEWDITVAGGNTAVLPPLVYTPANSNFSPVGFASGGPFDRGVAYSLQGNPAIPGSQRRILLSFVDALTAISPPTNGRVPFESGYDGFDLGHPVRSIVTGLAGAHVVDVQAGPCPTSPLSPPSVTISPPTGSYLTTQSFDLALLVTTGSQPIRGVAASLDGVDVSAALIGCLVPGTLVSGGRAFRCPGLSGATLGPGVHTLTVTLTVSTSASSTVSTSHTVTWDIRETREP